MGKHFDPIAVVEHAAASLATGGLYDVAKGVQGTVKAVQSGNPLGAIESAAGSTSMGSDALVNQGNKAVSSINKTAGYALEGAEAIGSLGAGALGSAGSLAAEGADAAETLGTVGAEGEGLPFAKGLSESTSGVGIQNAPVGSINPTNAAALLSSPAAALGAGTATLGSEGAQTGGAAIESSSPMSEAGIAQTSAQSASKTGQIGDVNPLGNPIGDIAKPPVPDNMQPGVDPEMTPSLSGATPASIDQMAANAFAPQTTVPASGSMTPSDLSSMSTFGNSVEPASNGSLLSNPMTYLGAAGLAGQGVNMLMGKNLSGSVGDPGAPQTVPGADNPGANDPALHAQVESQVALQAKSFTDTLLTGGMGVRDWNQFSNAPKLSGYSPYGF